MKRRKISNQKIAETYKKKACNVSATCAALNITRRCFYNWKEEDRELQQMLEDAEEAITDNVESKLFAAINEGNLSAIIFYLKCKAKNRGYIERSEHDVTLNSFEKLMQELPDE